MILYRLHAVTYLKRHAENRGDSQGAKESARASRLKVHSWVHFNWYFCPPPPPHSQRAHICSFKWYISNWPASVNIEDLNLQAVFIHSDRKHPLLPSGRFPSSHVSILRGGRQRLPKWWLLNSMNIVRKFSLETLIGAIPKVWRWQFVLGFSSLWQPLVSSHVPWLIRTRNDPFIWSITHSWVTLSMNVDGNSRWIMKDAALCCSLPTVCCSAL